MHKTNTCPSAQPGIPEFDFPLPPDAAGGTTGIYVNGRQLAARDLAMLRQRKFPQKERKRYTLDIGGTLKDEETGKVVSGRFAETVFRAPVESAGCLYPCASFCVHPVADSGPCLGRIRGIQPEDE